MSPFPLDIPAVVALIGASGSGKSNIAAAFPRSWRLSLDQCREHVSDDAGAQDSTAAAVLVFDAVLSGRLARSLTTVVDTTNTERAVRAALVERAHRHQMPAIAILVPTDLAICQARQQRRDPNRHVPAPVVARQHADVPSRDQLLTEGFDQVHLSTDLDLLGLLLKRSATAGMDTLADIRATFGPDLASVFSFDPDSSDSSGTFAVAGRTLTVRWSDHVEIFDQHWQGRVDTSSCESCGGTGVWVKVTDAADLLALYNGCPPAELFCDACDAPPW
jgi:predicted kinase